MIITQTMKEDKITNASPKLPYVQALPANSTPETRELACKLTDILSEVNVMTLVEISIKTHLKSKQSKCK